MVAPHLVSAMLRGGMLTPEGAEDLLLADALCEGGALARDRLDEELKETGGAGLADRLVRAGLVSPEQLDAARRRREERRLGPYEILETLGRGGMADVHLAFDTRLRRTVALKVLRTEGVTAKALERFHREALAAARLTHPGIAAIHEAGEFGDRHYVVMEYVDGGTLRDRLPQLTLRESVRIVEEAARAVHHAHTHSVIHRDIKPGNILLDREGRARVADFGLARIVSEESDLTASGEVCGTPHYMAPEQVKGEVWQISPRTDVYGLGATLYEAATGRPPFSETEVLRLYTQIIKEDPPAPHRLSRDIDAGLEAVILKALEKEPHLRYDTALDFAEDLRRWRDGQGVLARGPSVWRRAWRKLTRRDDALRDAKALYESLVETLPQLVFRKDPEGHITFANRRYCTMLGKSLEELVGKTDFDLFPRELALKYRSDDQRVMSTGILLDAEEEHVLPNGTPIFVQVVKSPLYNARGQLIGVQGIFWDITERRRIEQRHEELARRSVVDADTGAHSRALLEAVLPAFMAATGRVSLSIFRFTSTESLRASVESFRARLTGPTALLLRWDDRSLAIARVGAPPSGPPPGFTLTDFVSVVAEPGETAESLLARAAERLP